VIAQHCYSFVVCQHGLADIYIKLVCSLVNKND